MKFRGRVKWFNPKKGYGFITREDGSKDVFVHWSDIKSEGFKTLMEGEEVEFEEYTDQRGTKAVNVLRLSRSAEKKTEPKMFRPKASGSKRQIRDKFEKK